MIKALKNDNTTWESFKEKCTITNYCIYKLSIMYEMITKMKTKKIITSNKGTKLKKNHFIELWNCNRTTLLWRLSLLYIFSHFTTTYIYILWLSHDFFTYLWYGITYVVLYFLFVHFLFFSLCTSNKKLQVPFIYHHVYYSSILFFLCWSLLYLSPHIST